MKSTPENVSSGSHLNQINGEDLDLEEEDLREIQTVLASMVVNTHKKQMVAMVRGK